MAEKVKKKVKVEYFRVACRDIQEMDVVNTPDHLFDLHKWIDIFDDELKNISLRVKPYYGEKMRLDDFFYKDNLWVLDFMRMKDINVPKKAYQNKETEERELDDDEYIGENAIGVYDDKINVLALQRNRNSLSVTGVEKYINETWNHRDNNKIYLRPIMSDENIHTLFARRNKNYKKIRFKISDTGIDEKKYDNQSLGGIIQGLKSYDGAFVDVTVSMGRRKSNLNDVAVNSTLEELVLHSSVDRAEVYFKEGDEPVEYMDLLDGKLYDYAIVEQEVRKSVPSSYLAERVLERYANTENKIKRILKIE